MSTQLHPREYQTECIDAVWSAWDNGMQRPAVVLPTGSGKTVIFAHLSRQFTEINRETGEPHRVVILVHRDELADQAIDKIRSIAPELSVGKVKAADNETHADVMVCSVQTLARSARLRNLVDDQRRFGRIGLVVVDEAHHAAAQSYRDIMTTLGCFAGLTEKPGTQIDPNSAVSSYSGPWPFYSGTRALG